MAVTKKSDLFIPQVVEGKIATNYGNTIVVSRYAKTLKTLVGQPGDTVTRYQYQYIGDAAVLNEGADDTPVKLTASPVTKTIVKVSKQVLLTDESINSGAGDPWGEGAEQIGMSIAIKDDKDAITELLTTQLTASGANLAKAIVAGRKVFGERGLKLRNILFAHTADYYEMLQDYQNWIPASEIAANIGIKGAVGMYMGAYIIPTDTVAAQAPVLMLEGALVKEMKRGFLAERDRDLTNYTWLLAGSEHRIFWLQDATKAVKLSTYGVSLNKKTATVTAAAGDAHTTSLTATTTPAGETVTWTSSDSTKATVSSGTVTGVAAGTATITATITVDGHDYTDSCVVTVS